MSTTTKPRGPRNAAAIAASRTEAKAAETLAAQAVKVESQEASQEASKGLDEDTRRAFHVNAYRNAEHNAGQSKHAANVAAVAYFRTLPENVTVTTAKSTQVKPVSARERAERTLEALCVNVERNSNGKVTKGLDSIGFTVQRVTQLVDAFRNAEVALISLKVEEQAEALADSDPTTLAERETFSGKVEKLVSALDQAAVVGGKRAAEALASSVREQVEEQVEATGDDNKGRAILAVEAAREGVKAIREGKAAQAKSTPVVKTPAQTIGDAVQVLWDALEANAQDLDAGQKSAILAKVEALTKFLR